MGRTPPYRSSDRSIPLLRSPSDRRKVIYYEYGTEYNDATGKMSLFVDIINGNPDLVDHVGFRFYPSLETHNVRKRTKVKLSDGNFVWRFTLKQHNVTHWSKKVTVLVYGRGGARRVRQLTAKPTQDFRERSLKFLETRALNRDYVVVPDFRFGVEFETSLSGDTTSQDVVNEIRAIGVEVNDLTRGYRRGSENYQAWQLVPDESTVCSRSDPDCNRFELVSRILIGEGGLAECQEVLAALKRVGKVTCNKSMGFHVHVDVTGLSLERLKNICLNFVKHELVIDSFMPQSRLGSPFCQSNRDAILCVGNGPIHNEIVSCDNKKDLYAIINPGSRYYKLNLQNLNPTQNSRKQSKPTIEFRQHSCTTDFVKVEAWVRFCTSLVQNSVERPQKLKDYEDPFDSLFDTVIQDLKLKEFYRQRREELRHSNHHSHNHNHNHNDENSHSPCCGPCLKGGGSCEG